MEKKLILRMHVETPDGKKCGLQIPDILPHPKFITAASEAATEAIVRSLKQYLHSICDIGANEIPEAK